MKSNTTTLIAVIVMAVIAVAAVGGYIVLKDDGQDPDAVVHSSLPIMGNANSDDFIDQRDIDLIQEIIDGEKTLADYPYADANNDGIIDQKDIDVTRKLINGFKTQAFVVDQNDDIVEISYPLKNVVTINADMLSLVLQIGAQDKVSAYVATPYPVSQKAADDAGALNFGKGRALDSTNYVKLIDLDVSLVDEGGVGAILAMTDAAVSTYVADLNAAGIPVLRINCSEPIDSIDASLTIGFLFGSEIATNARAYYDASYNVIDTINEKLKDVKEEDKVKCLSLCMWSYVSETESAYTITSQLAGGNNISEIPGDGSSKLTSSDAITIYDEAKYFLSYRTLDYVNDDIIDTWENSKNNILKSGQAYVDGNLVFVNAIIPVPCRIAYVAEILYPDLFESGFGDEILQSFVDDFLPYLNENQDDGVFDVKTDMTTIITKSMYDAAKIE